jgi:hypothetical protein
VDAIEDPDAGSGIEIEIALQVAAAVQPVIGAVTFRASLAPIGPPAILQMPRSQNGMDMVTGAAPDKAKWATTENLSLNRLAITSSHEAKSSRE